MTVNNNKSRFRRGPWVAPLIHVLLPIGILFGWVIISTILAIHGPFTDWLFFLIVLAFNIVSISFANWSTLIPGQPFERSPDKKPVKHNAAEYGRVVFAIFSSLLLFSIYAFLSLIIRSG